ncbi:MAG: S8 family serine peptidase [Gemmatales bacterium]
MQPGTNQAAFAQQQGLSLVYSLPGSPDWAVFTPTRSGTPVTSLLGNIAASQQVKFSEQNYITQYTKFSFTPNDPLYATSGGFNGQWHLNNSLGRPSANLTAAGAWKSNTPGSGVIIGDVDDGIEPTHPDIAANFNATHTFDFIANSATQTFGSTDAHGMSTSGVAAARGGNGIGVTGSAPFAQIASMKVFTGSTTGTNAQFAAAVMYHSSGADTSVTIKNQSYGISSPFVSDTTHNNGITTSANAGTIHVLSAGNERGASGQDSNKKMAQANPNIIAVSALGFNGVFADYSCFGANITVTAPSNRTDVTAAGNSISTTDRVGANGYNTTGSGNYSDLSYTNDFGGTSSAAPLVTGIMALGKQANPALDVRLAKHILARTSTQVNAGDVSASSDGGWRSRCRRHQVQPELRLRSHQWRCLCQYGQPIHCHPPCYCQQRYPGCRRAGTG